MHDAEVLVIHVCVRGISGDHAQSELGHISSPDHYLRDHWNRLFPATTLATNSTCWPSASLWAWLHLHGVHSKVEFPLSVPNGHGLQVFWPIRGWINPGSHLEQE